MTPVELLLQWWASLRDGVLAARAQDGSVTLKYLLVAILAAAVFVVAFALFGDKVYERFQDLARAVRDAT